MQRYRDRMLAAVARETWNNEPSPFVQELCLGRTEAALVERNLAGFPATVRSRGVFFIGIRRLLEQNIGPDATAEALCIAGVHTRLVAFTAYAHRDFYRLYYLTARTLYPRERFEDALRKVAQTFYPIFRDSLLGKTIDALMGHDPYDVLPLLARAYRIAVEGNHHELELVGPREAIWRAQVEPVTWYPSTFEGIVRGALPDAPNLRFEVESNNPGGALRHYAFRIRW